MTRRERIARSTLPVALCVPVLFAGALQSAHALSFSVYVEAAAPASATPATEYVEDPSGSTPIHAEVWMEGSAGSAHADAFSGPDTFYISTWGQGESYDAYAELFWSEVVTNTGSAVLEIDPTFEILAGSLSVGGVGESTEEAGASYWIDILFNGTSVWSSFAELYDSGSTGLLFSESGASLGGELRSGSEGGSYEWDDFTLSGFTYLLEPGESLTIEYVLTGAVEGVGVSSGGSGVAWCDPADPDCFDAWRDLIETELGSTLEEEGLDCDPRDAACLARWENFMLEMALHLSWGGDGYGCLLDVQISPDCIGGVSSSTAIGDPVSLSMASPISYSTRTVGVPEPASWVMLAGGALALGVVARRRRRTE